MSRSELFRSRLVDGEYAAPERLPEVINSKEHPFNYNAFIAGDESYLIICSYREEMGTKSNNYYICFRDQRDNWSNLLYMGDEINSAGNENSPYVTRDGKYFFFSSSRKVNEERLYDGVGWFIRPTAFGDKRISRRELEALYNRPGNGNQDIYWVDTTVIERLRQQATW